MDEAARELWAVNKLAACVRGWVLRARGVQVMREFSLAAPLGMTFRGLLVDGVAAGSQAAELRVHRGLKLLTLGGKRPGSDAEAEKLILAAYDAYRDSGRPAVLRVLLSTGGFKDADPREDAAAIKITNFIRGVVALKTGLEYEVTFGEGSLGLVIQDLEVEEVMPDTQGAEQGVLPGSFLVSINNTRVSSDVEMAMAVKTTKRPFVMRFAKRKKILGPTRAGEVWKLSGGINGSKWKRKHLDLTSEGVLTAHSVKKSGYSEELCLGDCIVVEWRDEEFTRQHARKFRSGITLHFFVVQHADYDDGADQDEAVNIAKGSWVMCVEDGESYAAWMSALLAYV